MRFVPTTNDALTFGHAEEAFTGRIVGTTADATHRARQVVTFQEALILVAGKLASTVTVQDHQLFRLVLPQRR